MSVTLYSPNVGAMGVANDVRTTLNRYGNAKLEDLNIQIFDGGDKERETKAQAFRLTKHANLFLVERLNMPHPHRDGISVLVYRTTIRLHDKTYVATCYTNSIEKARSLIVDLTPPELQTICKQLGKTDLSGVWESLLRADRLERINVF